MYLTQERQLVGGRAVGNNMRECFVVARLFVLLRDVHVGDDYAAGGRDPTSLRRL